MVVETVCAILLPIIANFVFKLLQHRRQKLQWKAWVAQQDKQKLAEQRQREWDQAYIQQQQQAYLQQLKQDQARQAEKEGEKQQHAYLQQVKQDQTRKEANEQEKQQVHKHQDKQDQARQVEKERDKQEQDEIKQAWLKANVEKAARETKKPGEKKKQAEPEREKDAEWKRKILEELRQAKEQQDKEFQNLNEDLQKKINEADIMKNMVKQGIQLFLHFLRRLRHSSHGHHFRINGQPAEYQSYEALLASSGLIEEFGSDDEGEIHGILNSSLLLIEDKPGNSTIGASSSSPSLNNSNELMLLEIPEQIPEGFENDILSLVMTTLNGETLPTEEAHDEYKQYNDALREEGNAYFKDKNFSEAIKCYAMSIDQSPTAAAYANRAMAYIKLGKFNEAEKDCTEALKIDGRYFKAYARRAMSRKECGRDLYGALDDVDEALKLESSNQDMKALLLALKIDF